MARQTSFFKKHRKGITTTILLFLSLISLSIQNTSFVQGVEQGGGSFLFFFQNTFGSIGNWFQDTITSIQKLQDLEEEYQVLLDQVSSYQGLEQSLLDLRNENTILKEQLGFLLNSNLETIPAQIIAKDPRNYYETFTLDKGHSDGVRIDMPVVAAQDGYFALVGKIIQVGIRHSQVRPITDPNSYVAARFHLSRFEGLIRGSGSQEPLLFMDYVPKTALEEIQFGDLVVTSGMSQLYPRGIALGRVDEISSRDYESNIRLSLRSVLDFRRLEYVAVVTGGELR